MSKIIYAVSSGEYSDYRVHCVFSTKELAQVYKDYLMQDVKIANEIRVQLIALNIPFEEKAHKNFTDEQKELMNEILNKNIKKLI